MMGPFEASSTTLRPPKVGCEQSLAPSTFSGSTGAAAALFARGVGAHVHSQLR